MREGSGRGCHAAGGVRSQDTGLRSEESTAHGERCERRTSGFFAKSGGTHFGRSS